MRSPGRFGPIAADHLVRDRLGRTRPRPGADREGKGALPLAVLDVPERQLLVVFGKNGQAMAASDRRPARGQRPVGSSGSWASTSRSTRNLTASSRSLGRSSASGSSATVSRISARP